MIIGSINSEIKKLINLNNPTTIIFASHFNEYLEEDIFPDSVEKIIFGYKSNKTTFDYILEDMIYNMKLITDDDSFSKFNSKSINNFAANVNIKWIIFPLDSTFNQELLTLPINLNFLSLGWNYTKSLLNLPIGLKYFILSTQTYNPDIAKIPEGIEYFGIKTSNDMILSKLPKMTKYVNLNKFKYGKNVVVNDNTVLDLLPDKIETLKLYCSYKSELKNLPNNLKKLHISNLSTLETLKNLPPLLESLDITFSSRIYSNDDRLIYFSNLPNGLKYLKIDVNFSATSNNKPIFNLDNLPNSLSKLVIYTHLFNGIFDNLPNFLEEFETEFYKSDEFDNNIFNNLPRNLKKMKICIPQYDHIPRNRHSEESKNINFYLNNKPINLKNILIPEVINFNSDKKFTIIKFDEHYNMIEFN